MKLFLINDSLVRSSRKLAKWGQDTKNDTCISHSYSEREMGIEGGRVDHIDRKFKLKNLGVLLNSNLKFGAH